MAYVMMVRSGGKARPNGAEGKAECRWMGSRDPFLRLEREEGEVSRRRTDEAAG